MKRMLVLIGVLLLSAADIRGQTALTYQGHLRSANSPANGNHNMTFALFAGAMGGGPVAGPLTVNGVDVDEGLFTVRLDFGAGAFNGSTRWLEVAVNGVTLFPRTEITAAPAAMFSLAGPWIGLTGVPAGFADGIDNEGGLTLPFRGNASVNGAAFQIFNTIAPGNATAIRGQVNNNNDGSIGVEGVSSAGSARTFGVRGESGSPNGTGVLGRASAASGVTVGVRGESTSPDGTGVLGIVAATSGFSYGVRGQSDSPDGRGVYGLAAAATGNTRGVLGQSASTSGLGVYGLATAATGLTYGGYFESASTSGRGINGLASAATGTTWGVSGACLSTSGRGVYGLAAAASGTTYGVYGQTNSPDGYAGYFQGRGYFSGNVGIGTNAPDFPLHVVSSSGGTVAYAHATAASGWAPGLYGQSDSTSGIGVEGYAPASSGATRGVIGIAQSTAGIGVHGEATSTTGVTSGVFGQCASTSGLGVHGLATAASGNTYGVWGQSVSTSGRGVYGSATAASGDTYGVYGTSASAGGEGVFGEATAATGNTYGGRFHSLSTSGVGVFGLAPAHSGTNYGVFGLSPSTSGYGVFGQATAATGTIYGVYGQASTASSGYAVFASGDLGAAGVKSFRIDHPFDPENKYLLHYASESPSPQNFYSGNVITDAEGHAWVELPDYFAEINANFKYQLTILDDTDAEGFVQVKVSRKIHGNRFQVRTSAPNVEVSWRVEADRNDAYVQFKRPTDVIEKQDLERGTYQHPELYDMPPEKSMNYNARRE